MHLTQDEEVMLQYGLEICSLMDEVEKFVQAQPGRAAPQLAEIMNTHVDAVRYALLQLVDLGRVSWDAGRSDIPRYYPAVKAGGLS
ncbi:hypothetical protein [Methanocella sp. MCL-LM]|uniref:hypothetical protein n=1 Tax=Methanocella sp. MCL-LM TaxID=3412035 RepID=UPI003C72C8CE